MNLINFFELDKKDQELAENYEAGRSEAKRRALLENAMPTYVGAGGSVDLS